MSDGGDSGELHLVPPVSPPVPAGVRIATLGLGERLHPELDEVYISNPDRALPDPVSAADLRRAWSEVNGKLTAAFEKLTPAQWLEKHTAVSDEDFAKDPTRNRLAVLMSRTSHVAFHTGQAALIKSS
jgi:hypothetical protein